VANLVAMLQKERSVLLKRVESLEHAISGLAGTVSRNVKSAVKPKRKMSAAARKKMSAAKAKWWADKKKKNA
jgi:hypothetical protein